MTKHGKHKHPHPKHPEGREEYRREHKEVQSAKPHHDHEENAIKEGLQAIYGKEEMQFDKLDQGKNNRLTRWLMRIIVTLIALLVFGVGGWLGYTYWLNGGEREYLKVTIEAPETPVSGETAEIRISYKNPNKQPVADLDIDINLPKSFTIDSMLPLPTDEEELVWDIGTIGGQSDGEIVIKGVWIESIETAQVLQALANFRPSNFNSEFQTIARKDVTTETSIISLEATAGSEGAPGRPIEHQVTLKNTSETLPMDNIIVRASVPDGFFLDESNPAVEAGGPIEWRFDSIAPQEEINITYTGSFAGDVSGFQYSDIEIFAERDNRSYLQAKEQVFTDVLTSALSTLLVVNGATDSTTARLGSTLRTSISIENTGNALVEDAELLLNFEANKGIPINWNTSGLNGGRVTSEGIYWSASIVGPIDQNGNATFNLNLPILDSLDSNRADQFTITAELTSGGITIKSTPIMVTISTDASLNVEARYYDENGNQVGRGPLPPKVGEATRYQIIWTLTNSLHPLERVEIESSLPPYVRFIGSDNTDLGTLTQEMSGAVVWNIPSVPADINKVQATFTIEVTPPNGSNGSFLKLIPSTTMQVRDAVSETDIQQTAGAVDTELPTDSFAEGRGVVE